MYRMLTTRPVGPQIRRRILRIEVGCFDLRLRYQSVPEQYDHIPAIPITLCPTARPSLKIPVPWYTLGRPGSPMIGRR